MFERVGISYLEMLRWRGGILTMFSCLLLVRKKEKMSLIKSIKDFSIRKKIFDYKGY